MEHEHKMTTRAIVARYMKKRWKRPAQVIGAGLAVGLAAGFGPFHKSDRGQTAQNGEVRVQGEVQSLWSKGVGSPFEGPIQAINVREGQSVRKGQLLFRMDTTALQSALSTARAEYQSAREELAEARAGQQGDLAATGRAIAGLRSEIAAERRRAAAPTESAAESTDAAAAESAEGDYQAAQDGQPEAAVYDPAHVQELTLQLDQALRGRQEQRALWAPRIQAAEERCSHAAKQAGQLQAMLHDAGRKSPMDGIVTGVYATPGNYVASRSPVVRVDNPEGYRVVTLVDQKVRDGLEAGKTLPLVRRGAPADGRLEKIVAGWDRELFKYWLWVKPAEPRGLTPGQTVEVAVPVGSTAMASN